MKKLQLNKLSKSLQRSLYTFSTSTYGACVLVVFAFITLNSLLHLIQSFVGIGIVNRATFFGDECSETCDKLFFDNVGRVNVKDRLCFNQPMDIVYTWVNGSDPIHAKELAYYTRLEELQKNANFSLSSTMNSTLINNATNAQKDNSVSGSNRFRDNEELRYSLRSIEKFAPWIRKVFIVTNGQVPYWLNTKNSRVKIVSHADIFLNKSHLPTFSSPAIEAHLHRIKGLSDHFIYLNDDVMFGNNVYPTDFLSLQPNTGGQKVFLSWDVPDCAPGCGANWIGDGYCDTACNNTACDWDGGDCIGAQRRTGWSSGSTSSYSSSNSPWMIEQSLRQVKLCAKSCFDHWIGDKFCDNPCNVPECGFDAGDCGFTRIIAELPGAKIKAKTTKFLVKGNIKSMYCDLSEIIPEDSTIKSGSHDNHSWIRGSTISQKQRMMTLTFLKSADEIAALNATILNSAAQSKTNATSEAPAAQPKPASPYLEKNVTLTVEFEMKVKDAVTNEEKVEQVALHILLIGKDPNWSEFKNTNTSVIEVSLSTPTTEKEQKEEAQPNDAAENVEQINEQGNADNEQNEDNANEEQLIDDKDLVPQNKREIRAVMKEEEPAEDGENEGHGNVVNNGRKLLSIDENQNTKIRIERSDDHGIHVRNTLRDNFVDRVRQLNEQQRAKVEIEKELELEKAIKETDDSNVVRPHPGRRRLLDKFGDSLIHVNKLLNKRYGRVARKVPAHMPHMIQKKVMEEAQELWAPYFDKTSSNRFRSSDDMQYSFTYFYYLMHEGKNYSAIEFFSNLDTDKDGVLNSGDVRLLTRLMDKKWKIAIKKVKDLSANMTAAAEVEAKQVEPQADGNNEAHDAQLQPENANNENPAPTPAPAPAAATNTSTPPSGATTWTWGSWKTETDPYESFNDYLKSVEQLFASTISYLKVHNLTRTSDQIDFEVFVTSGLSDVLHEATNQKINKYEYTLSDLGQVAFHMLRDNYDRVADQLDDIRINKHKFICLNDDMNQTHPNPEVKKLLHDFYEWYFPHRSQFELPEGEVNPFLYIDQLDKHIDKQKYMHIVVNAASVLIMVFVCLCMVQMRAKSVTNNNHKYIDEKDLMV